MGRGNQPRRKQTQRRHPKRAAGGAEPSTQALVKELTGIVQRSIRSEAAPASALEAEMMASEIFGLLDELPLKELPVMPRDLPLLVGQELIHRVEQDPLTNVVGFLHGLSLVGPPELAKRAEAAVGRLEAKGSRRPAWATGPSRFTRGWIGGDVYGDRKVGLAEFQHPGQEPHAITLLIDPNEGGLVKNVIVSQSADEMLAQWSGMQPDVVFEESSSEQFARLLAGGLDAAESYASNDLVGEEVASARALLVARLKTLPQCQAEDLERDLDEVDRAVLVDRFLASSEASHLAQRELVAECAVDFKIDYGDGDPLRWSPEVVSDFLLGWFPRKVTMPGQTVEGVPDALRAWVRFAGRQKGLARHLISATEREVDACREEFLQAWADPRSYGPAKSMVLALAADGIDPRDRDAVESWLESHRDVPWTEFVHSQPARERPSAHQ